MKKRKRTIVDMQSLSEIRGSEYSYSNSLDEHGESVLANPDQLPEQKASPTSPQLLMGEAIEHLQGRQKEVYLLTMREGLSLAEVGDALSITKSTAQVHLDRAIKFITAYCEEGIKGGRV